jgi:2-amino-4-hydroxy-6-hydroxymethyldihydropteridine diphosphokinase
MPARFQEVRSPPGFANECNTFSKRPPKNRAEIGQKANGDRPYDHPSRLRADEDMNKVYLSLGSNLGDRKENIARAIAMLGERGVHVRRESSLYETEPIDIRDGGWFLNGAIEAETQLTPAELMQVLLEIERALGRQRKTRPVAGLKESRTIDLDILLFGSSAVRQPGVEIPHPRMAERKFVLAPLAEIAPDVRHPVLERTIVELLAASKDRSAVRPFKE